MSKLRSVVTTVLGDLGLNRAPKVQKNAWGIGSRYKKGVDARLTDILSTAADRFAQAHPGYTVTAISGKNARKSGTRWHPSGIATDVQITDPSGKKLGNYQNAKTFRMYEQYAQTARTVQQEMHPELNKNFTWGGYFGGNWRADIMHFDLGPTARTKMGTWEGGLNKEGRKRLAGAESVGMSLGPMFESRQKRQSELANAASLHAIQNKREYERPSFSAPVGKVTRGTLAAPTLAGVQRTRTTTAPALTSKSVFDGFTRPTVDTPRNFPGMSVPADTASPHTMAKTLGGIGAVVGSLADAPRNRTTPKTNRLQQTFVNTAAITPTATQFDERKQAIEEARLATALPPDMVVPAAVVPENVVQQVPQTLAQPKRVTQRVVRRPVEITVRQPRQQTISATMPGGTLGGIRAQDRFSVGTGVQGITAAMGGVRGATGFSRSNPGVSVTNRGGTLGTITRNDKFGTTTFRDPSGNVTGVHYDGGIGSRLGHTLGSIFGGGSSSSSSSSGKSSGSSSSGKSSGSSGGGRRGGSTHSSDSVT